MAIETIESRSFESLLRQEVHDQACWEVAQDAERFLHDYALLPETNGGRYISADAFKELFPAYAASKAGRNVFNAPVHNAAAVLAAEQFKRMLRVPDSRRHVLFVTGIPGAGKTCAFAGRDLLDYRLVYERQLSDFAEAEKKIRETLHAGCTPTILVVDSDPERALRNTWTRFKAEGRGASMNAMASIQASLPETLHNLANLYSGQISIVAIHLDRDHIPKEITGDIFTQITRGSTHEIESRLIAELAILGQEQKLGDAYIRQCHARAPNARSIRDAGKHARSPEGDARQAEIPAGGFRTNQPC
ncbi:MAG: hypothetical protein ACYCSS_06030 [Sulfuriferula sp.]